MSQAQLSWTERPIGTVPFVVSSTQKLTIPRDNAIRRINMRVDINYTTGATAPTYTEDDFLNLIANVRIQRNGSDNKINVSARMWYYVEDYEKGGTPARKTAASSATTTTTDCFFVLVADFATFRENEHDISALLQTKNLSSLELQIDWLSNAVVATANAPTLNAASNVQVDIREVSGVVPDNNGKLQDINDDTVITMANIYEAEQIVVIDANHSSFDADTLAVDVTPAPANLLKQAILVLDATSPNGNKSDTLVTEYKVQRESPFIYRYKHRKYPNQLETDKMQYQIQTLVTGFLYLDWIDQIPNGLLNNRNTGDIKYRFLTANYASGQTIRLYKRYVYVPRVQ